MLLPSSALPSEADAILPSSASLVILLGSLVTAVVLAAAAHRRWTARVPTGQPASEKTRSRIIKRSRWVGALGIGLALYGWSMASPAIARDRPVEPVWVAFIIVGLVTSTVATWRDWRVRRGGQRRRRWPR